MNNLNDIFSIDVFKCEDDVRQPQRSSKTADTRPFFMGNVPWEWIAKAARLPGKSLQVGIALWHLHTLQKSLNVKMEQKWLRDLGVHRNSYYRALLCLEGAGLVKADQNRGRNARILLIVCVNRLHPDIEFSAKV